MNKEIVINQIKTFIISNLAVNESIIVDLFQYNDALQGNTYLAFTQSRIFFWHENDTSNRLKSKSYNLVKLVMVSRGIFSIHFNDEIVKLLLPDNSEEALKMIEILSQYVEIQYPQAEKPIIAQRKLKTKKQPKPKQDNSNSKISLKTILKIVIPIMLVIILSVFGTLSYSYISEWLSNRNVDTGLTTEKVDAIREDIASVEKRVFMFEEYEQVLNNYLIQLESITSEIKAIDPADKTLDWVAASNRISNFKMTLYNLPPKEFLDNGKVFDLDNQYATSQTKNFYDKLNLLLDEANKGIENKFNPLTDLIRLEQASEDIKTEIQNSITAVKSEIGKLNAYTQEQKALINQ